MKSYISKILYILEDRKKSLLILLLSILLTSLLEAFGIGLLGPFIALASNPSIIQENAFLKQLYEFTGFAKESHFIAALALAIVLIFYFKSFLNFCIRRYIFLFSLHCQGNLRSRLLKTYIRLPYQFFLKKNTAFLIQNIINETTVFANKVLLEILNSSVSFIVLSVLIGLLVLTDALATLVISVMLLSVFAVIVHFKTKLSSWGKVVSKSQAEMIRVVNHSLGGLKETKIIGCEPYFIDQLDYQGKRYADSLTSLMSFNFIPRIVIEAVIITFILGLMSVSLLLGGETVELISTLGVFAIVAIRLMPLTTQLSSGLSKIRSSTYVVDKLYHDFHELEKTNLYNNLDAPSPGNTLNGLTEGKNSSLPFNHKVNLSQITFRYEPSSDAALENIDLTIEKGKSIALIGKSGAGKTTLVDMILGLLSPESGDIQVDGKSVYKDLRSWQNLIGYIPQSIFLIDDTIERNIAFGVPDHLIDPERLKRAIEAAQLTELTEQLPQGLKTNVGERGVCLSGGQRQRVGIARAIYHEREILVLDEATSALDNETEGLVTEAIRSLSGRKTMIIIAHRLTTVEHCDRIYLMEKGSIVNSGSYREVVLDGNPIPN